ncbi:hypothetical protein AAG906_026241 [Vitis piasezkii]
MKSVPYASTVGNLMYVMLYTRPDICFVSDRNSRKSTFGFMCTLGRRAVSWRSVK